MITLDDFYRAHQTVFGYQPDPEKRQAVDAAPSDALFLVAGPGTGKTAALTLRMLKLVLVDGVPPRGILATTFTKKAAAELRSRILGWGFRLIEALQADKKVSKKARDQLACIDINQILTGTIDSICEQLLRDYRDPGTHPPIVADDFVSKTLLLREGLLDGGRFRDADLDAFLLDLHGGSRWGWHVGRKNDLLQTVWDRRFHDQVNWSAFLKSGPRSQREARKLLGDALAAYEQALADRSMVDFALLENEVLTRLRSGQLVEFLDQLEAVLVDEYQDTNLLQDGIYFELAKACGGAFTVVGDDDQSLYRFRGATVELFSDFANRYRKVFKCKPATVFLKTNYRSSQAVVGFVNAYAVLDSDYQRVRVSSKPALVYGPKATTGVPILAMFRDDVGTLSRDLAQFVHRVFRGKGYRLPGGMLIEREANGGDVGDCALLCSSPSEYNASNQPRLPLLLRQDLGALRPPIEVFNPRGQDLTGIRVVELFGGLLLECLDPGGAVEVSINGLAQDIQNTFQAWRNAAINFAQSKAAPSGLEDFAIGWADRDPKRAGSKWPRSVPVLELVYALVHFFPELYDDPEGQIYLEVFTRQVTACEQVGRFKGRVVTDPENPGLSDASVKELLRDFLAPIAGGTIKVNEELMETFPRDRLSVLSIHQSKGLEFPLTIVDVGSDFKSNHSAHRFKRFPKDGGPPHRMEDLLRPHSALGARTRGAVDRAFDDLFRQFFVAYSRPQQVLLLVGLTKTKPGGQVPNVATGWDRDRVCQWDGGLPFTEI